MLTDLESESIYVIREARARYGKLGLLWSVGKDSTALLWMCRKAFLGTVPFPVIHIDTSYKFPQMYELRDRLAREWKLDLVVRRNERALAAGMGPDRGSTLACCTALKTDALKDAIAELELDAVLVGIRRDEHGIRGKERYFSPRDAQSRWEIAKQPAELWDLYRGASGQTDSGAGHVRVHPLLHFSERDIWEYTQREKVPVVDLYFGQAGARYRSIGCRTCCSPTASGAEDIPEILTELRTSRTGERAGRAQDKESAQLMQKLRTLGYM